MVGQSSGNAHCHLIGWQTVRHCENKGPIAEPNLVILMRHRAVLFGLVGLLMLVAAFRSALVPAAFIAGFVSVASFLWLAWSVGGYNPQIARVVVVDLVALACLVIGAVAHAYLKPVV